MKLKSRDIKEKVKAYKELIKWEDKEATKEWFLK